MGPLQPCPSSRWRSSATSSAHTAPSSPWAWASSSRRTSWTRAVSSSSFGTSPFIGEESFRAAEATECARDQDKFWEYHDTVFENWNGVNKGAYSDDNLKRFASSLQLDRDVFDSCLANGKYRGKVEEDVQLGERQGVNSTPSLFLQGNRIQVGSYSELAQLIEAAIAAAQ